MVARAAMLVLILGAGVDMAVDDIENRDLVIVTVATNRTDGYRRFERSCKLFNFEVRTLGMGQGWKGGNMAYAGGGWKVNLLKEELEKMKDEVNTIVMFTDSYDVVVTAGKEALLSQFDTFGSKIVFGSEGFCWPDSSLAKSYPEVKVGKRYLNSGGFIGSASNLYNMLISGGESRGK